MHAGGFEDWQSLTRDVVNAAADAPGAVQLCTRDRRLIAYPKGKSAMVFYFYAARSVREALLRLFADELDVPGARGEGALSFRVLLQSATHPDDARQRLTRLYDEFEALFGAPPILHTAHDDG